MKLMLVSLTLALSRTHPKKSSLIWLPKPRNRANQSLFQAVFLREIGTLKG